jgi:nucleotide-binding universal stress UspA family protein
MTPFKTILFAADFSENSREAFRAASSLAADDQARLIVLHVAELARPSAEMARRGGLSAPILDQLGTDDDETLFERLREFYVPNHAVDVSFRVKKGEIAHEILRTASSVAADLIVMGTHGRTGLRRLFAGSVATAVLRGAHCPVLALRSGASAAGVQRGQVILHPTDFSENSEPALSVARMLARSLGARLVVLHVAPMPVVMGGSMASEIDPRYYSDVLDGIRAGLDGPDLKYPVETLFRQGFEPEMIRQVATELDCDLIVMGTHGRSGITRLLLGSVAEPVLSKADCPVMVVRAIPRATAAAPGHSDKKPLTVS